MAGIAEYIPFFDKLTEEEKQKVLASCYEKSAVKDEIVHHAGGACIGIIIVKTGQLRAYTTPENGKEVTLYRLFPYDLCMFSASCIFDSSAVPISLEAEEESSYIVLPTEVYSHLEKNNMAVALYMNSVMKERFADIMWLLDQILNKRMNSRLAALLLEEGQYCDCSEIQLTQEKLASHLGTAREVVTRTLKYLQDEELITIHRGSVTILDRGALEELAKESIK